MNDDFDREGLIELLGKLDSDDEQEILKTVTALKAGMKASGKTWDDLIADPAADSYEQDVEDDDDEEEDDQEDDDGETASAAAPDNEESLKIIDKMLSKFQLSEHMREELQGYKEDIAENEFDARDRQYLKALHGRLSKNQ